MVPIKRSRVNQCILSTEASTVEGVNEKKEDWRVEWLCTLSYFLNIDCKT